VADLEYQVRDHVATILPNRPERRNAFTLAMVEARADALAQAQRDPEVRVIVSSGSGA
jgi:enoyl-CoA hydratase/carnithine racemase